ncbi:MAG: saccharopine dehydrogenase NADP-binding domain-containing protein [Melioribacteraceae bacterium]|nr:saccharopine dehydrogenase NADP-binding domain-containing protein [Melioribacteraceae bacterium]MCF8354158.1 saccharopine dehydrogenase NADP-binding domain-containing protein [Melioribacteraceae bacterium]MCF8396028.1 saccharopine dehydrogenase NADP-binding domain-containing protein [Melioribacteraceae bacterium]MCF8418081.1 saccharopine dehydrogenase NADP-binding domain-containing protein [Melioribacteraceae bacterium]
MKNVLILGAGQSTPFLITFMLKEAEKNDWYVTVCDRDYEMAAMRINGHPRGNAVEFDVNDAILRQTQIQNSDIVINLLAPVFQYTVAVDCIQYEKPCITASYEDNRMRDLNKDALRKNILILNEMGLDPGIDHMSAMKMIDEVRDNGGIIRSFCSYGSGLPAPNVESNPLRYCITWNPRNIAMAGEKGAQYMENDNIKVVPHHEVFRRTWQVDVDDVGTFEAYPNRDSLVYLDTFSLKHAHTMIRGTLRYPGWSETWLQIIKLGMPNENMRIPNLNKKTFAEFTEMFVPLNANGTKLSQRVANYLGISPTGKITENLRWLGLFSDEKIPGNPQTAADVLIDLLQQKLPLPKGAHDMVALIHELEVEYPEKNEKEIITSTFVEYGDGNGITAIAKTVGMPAAIAAKLILQGELPLTGCHIPIHPTIYTRVLDELKTEGLKFIETKKKLNGFV